MTFTNNIKINNVTLSILNQDTQMNLGLVQ